MKKTLLVSIMFFAFLLSSFAQPVINKFDMPNAGDTLRISSTVDFASLDYMSTGVDYQWDFSSITNTIQRLDTIMDISAAAGMHQLVFNNPFDEDFQATTVQKYPALDNVEIPLVGITISNAYAFYKETDDTYSNLGLGATVSGSTMPIKFSSPDVLYKLPLTLGEKDSSTSSFNIQLPGMGYLAETRKRVNYVDGWGTVTTPLGSFPAIRVLSTSYIHDSIYVEMFSMGQGMDRIETEYKWLSDNKGIPVISIRTSEGLLGSSILEYLDSNRTQGISSINQSLLFVGLYPNPASESTNLTFALNKPEKISIEITDVLGKTTNIIDNAEYSNGMHTIPLGDKINTFSTGIYFVTLTNSTTSKTLKLTIN